MSSSARRVATMIASAMPVSAEKALDSDVTFFVGGYGHRHYVLVAVGEQNPGVLPGCSFDDLGGEYESQRTAGFQLGVGKVGEVRPQTGPRFRVRPPVWAGGF